MLVMKFGGTSVGSSERLRGVHELIKSARNSGEDLVLVLSAMSGTTNALIDGAHKAVKRDLKGALQVVATIRDAHIQAVENLFYKCERSMQLLKDIQGYLDELDILFRGISYLGELTKGRLMPYPASESFCPRRLWLLTLKTTVPRLNGLTPETSW